MNNLILFVLAFGGAVWASALLLGDPLDRKRDLSDGHESLNGILPESSYPGTLPGQMIRSHKIPWPSGRISSLLGPDGSRRFKDVWALAALHAGVALELLPVAILVIVAGFTAGLARREGLRSGSRFASPLRSWIGKRIALLGLGGSLVFALTPLLLPWWTLWAGILVAAGGAGLFVSNLPLKL